MPVYTKKDIKSIKFVGLRDVTKKGSEVPESIRAGISGASLGEYKSGQKGSDTKIAQSFVSKASPTMVGFQHLNNGTQPQMDPTMKSSKALLGALSDIKEYRRKKEKGVRLGI